MASSLTFLTFPNSQLRQEQHEEGEPEPRVPFPLPGASNLAREAWHVLFPVTGHVPDHGAGKLLIRLDPHLHTPMFFFLSHLALTDVSFSSIIVPKMLMNMQTQDQSIPNAGCISQFLFSQFWVVNNFPLRLMAYDSYVCICQSLQYITIMRQELCVSFSSCVLVPLLYSCPVAQPLLCSTVECGQ